MVESNADRREGFMRVYIQVPNEGAEFFPREDRAKQATTLSPTEIAAMKAFHEQESTITPQLLGLTEAKQDDEGFVPGGYIIHMVTERVPGTRLADDFLLPGYGAPSAFFQKFTRPQRDEIRECFDKELPKLRAMGWFPDFRKFVDFRRASDLNADYLQHPTPKTTKLVTWGCWGLAIPPGRLEEADTSKWTL
ncbi:hypothetical protein N7528_002809 [Penicillium herquei]|nr:hypothetical protein N7528_002809 [Penicillium herquei]